MFLFETDQKINRVPKLNMYETACATAHF